MMNKIVSNMTEKDGSFPPRDVIYGFKGDLGTEIRESSQFGGGRGVFATRNIAAGCVVGIMTGLLVKDAFKDLSEYGIRIGNFRYNGEPSLFTELEGFLNVAPYMNETLWHVDTNNVNCEPNGLMVLRSDVRRGEELTWHYGNSYNWDPYKKNILLPHLIRIFKEFIMLRAGKETEANIESLLAELSLATDILDRKLMHSIRKSLLRVKLEPAEVQAGLILMIVDDEGEVEGDSDLGEGRVGENLTYWLQRWLVHPRVRCELSFRRALLTNLEGILTPVLPQLWPILNKMYPRGDERIKGGFTQAIGRYRPAVLGHSPIRSLYGIHWRQLLASGPPLVIKKSEADRIEGSEQSLLRKGKNRTDIFRTPSINNTNEIMKWWKEPNESIMVGGNNGMMSVRSLRSLSGSLWLNDEVMSTYAGLMTSTEEKEAREQGRKKALVFGPNLYNKMVENEYNFEKVRRWTGRTGRRNASPLLIFQQEAIFLIINTGGHWVFVHVSFVKRSIDFYDSASGSAYISVIDNVCKWLVDEGRAHSPCIDIHLELWNKRAVGCIKQVNGFDCGIHVLISIRLLLSGLEPTFTAAEVTLCRLIFASEIIAGRLQDKDENIQLVEIEKEASPVTSHTEKKLRRELTAEVLIESPTRCKGEHKETMETNYAKELTFVSQLTDQGTQSNVTVEEGSAKESESGFSQQWEMGGTFIPDEFPWESQHHKRTLEVFEGETSDKSINIMSLNVNSLNLAKLEQIVDWMRQLHIDVALLQDIRTNTSELAFLKKDMNSRPKLKKYWLEATGLPNKETVGQVGGQAILCGSRIGQPKYLRADRSGLNIVVTAIFKMAVRELQITSCYWPSLGKATEGSLQGKVISYMESLKSSMSVGDFVQKLTCETMAECRRSRDACQILVGDFNTSWMNSKTGYPSFINFIESLDMEKCNLIKEPTWWPKPKPYASAIDHIFAGLGHLELIHSGSLLVAAEREVFFDHVPILASFHHSEGFGKLRSRGKLLTFPHVELKLSNKKMCAEYAMKMQELLQARKDSGKHISLPFFQRAAVTTTLSIQTKRPGKHLWSPEAAAIGNKIRFFTELCRRLSGDHRYRKIEEWEIEETMNNMIRSLASRIESMARNEEQAYTLREIGFNMESLQCCNTRERTLQDAKELVQTLKRAMHVKQRRLLYDACRHFSKRREFGSLGLAIRSIQGKPRGNTELQMLTGQDGNTILDPKEIHETATAHFKEWMRAKQKGGFFEYDQLETLTTSYGDFEKEFSGKNIPTHLIKLIFRAIQKPMKQQALTSKQKASFAGRCRETPTFQEFIDAVRASAANSAAGVSQCSYNMIKALLPTKELPESETLRQLYETLVTIWEKKDWPWTWRWKWLVVLPKGTGTGLDDLRPLTLVDALRKIWSSIIVRKIMGGLIDHKLLSEAHCGFVPRKSTADANLPLTDLFESARENKTHLLVSSWDVKKAFDSVPRPALVWAWLRMGVPKDIAEFLVEVEGACPTVLRSPLAAHLFAKKGLTGFKPGVSKENDECSYFLSELGVGQGDIPSPLNWVLFYDMLIAALENDEELRKEQYYFNDGAYYTDKVFADDLVSATSRIESLQRKADIVSAFALIFGLTIAANKLRTVGMYWGTEQIVRPALSEFRIYGEGWSPSVIPIATVGSIKALGYNFDLTGDGKSQYSKTLYKCKADCAKIVARQASPRLKMLVLQLVQYRQVAYVAQFCNWSYRQCLALDVPFSAAYRKMLGLSPSFPTSILYLPKKLGGFGIQRLSNEMGKAKLNLMFAFLHSGDMCRTRTMTRLLKRAWAYTENGLVPNRSSKCVHREHAEPIWADSLLEWAREAGVYLQIQGAITSAEEETIAGHFTARKEDMPEDIRSIASMQGLQLWKELEEVRTGKLTEDCAERSVPGIVQQRPVLVGQFWMCTTTTTLYKIQGIEYKSCWVSRWNRQGRSKWWCLRDTDVRNGEISGHSIETKELEVMRQVITGPVGAKCGKAAVQMIGICPPSRPYLTSLIDSCRFPQLTSLMTNAVAIYTDGSFTSDNGFLAKTGIRVCDPKISAAVIIKYKEADGYGYRYIHIQENTGQLVDAGGAELAAMSLALRMVKQSGINVPIISDCESMLKKVMQYEGRRFTYKSKYPALMAAAQTLAETATLQWTRGHPERTKKKLEFTDNDWGIYIADRIADRDYTEAGTTEAEVVFVSFLEVMSWMGVDAEFAWVDDKGDIIANQILKRKFDAELKGYLSTRDEYGQSMKPDTIADKWKKHNTTATVLHWNRLNKDLTMNELAQSIKFVLDKHWHGRNKSKAAFSMKTGEWNKELRGELAGCSFCNSPVESMEHLLLHCSDCSLSAARAEWRKGIADFRNLPQEFSCITSMIEWLKECLSNNFEAITGNWTNELVEKIIQSNWYREMGRSHDRWIAAVKVWKRMCTESNSGIREFLKCRAIRMDEQGEGSADIISISKASSVTSCTKITDFFNSTKSEEVTKEKVIPVWEIPAKRKTVKFSNQTSISNFINKTNGEPNVVLPEAKWDLGTRKKSLLDDAERLERIRSERSNKRAKKKAGKVNALSLHSHGFCRVDEENWQNLLEKKCVVEVEADALTGVGVFSPEGGSCKTGSVGNTSIDKAGVAEALYRESKYSSGNSMEVKRVGVKLTPSLECKTENEDTSRGDERSNYEELTKKEEQNQLVLSLLQNSTGNLESLRDFPREGDG